MAEIQTRIILRNDADSAWESSTLALKKGEAAVEIKGDKAKLKVATADNQTFAAAPYIGGEEANVFQVELGSDETDIEAAIAATVGSTELAKGDIAIVKASIAGDKYSYTCYIYDGTNWAAADGNYRSDNVYFDSDLTYTANIGVFSVPSSGSGIIPAEGKNVKEVLSSILAAPKNPTTNQPYITVSGTTSEVEIGTTVNLSYTINTNAGSYTYGPATGVTFETYSATCDGETENTKTGSFSVIAETAAKTVSASATHTDGAVPVNNLGTAYPAGQIKAGTKSASGCKVTGVRHMFYGPCTSDLLLDSEAIRKLTHEKAVAKTLSTAAGAGCVKYAVAVPQGRSIAKVLLTSSMNADITAEFKKQVAVQVQGAEGYAATAYDLYVYQPAKIDAGEEYAITIG